MLDESELSRIRKQHNTEQVLSACGYGFLSLVLWWISYWAIWLGVNFPARSLKIEWLQTAAPYLVWGVMLILFFEGIRYSRPLFDLQNLVDSAAGEAMSARTGGYYSWRLGIEMGKVYVISQILLAAPRTGVHLLLAIRRIVFMRPDEMTTGVKIMNDVGMRKEWVSEKNFERKGATISKLKKMGLLWERETAGDKEVRVAMEVQAKFFTDNRTLS